MLGRQEVIAHSIQHSITQRDTKSGFLNSVSGLLYVHWLAFERIRPDLFDALRKTWEIKDDDYLASFGGPSDDGDALKSMGDMGYSGSTFFRTADSAYLVKSIPRHFEHAFFKQDLLEPYVEYMTDTPGSLLIRITDFLECTHRSIGTLFGLAPTHQMIMENIMYGQDQRDENSDWESWDLKPMSYFYPERDVVGGVLSSEATISKLADDFNESIVLDRDQAEDLKAQLEKDTGLLRDCNAVDYSLFLVRMPASIALASESQPSLSSHHGSSKSIPPAEPPFAPPNPPTWRTGIKSADGQYVYRAAILDFFWAKHKVHAKAMTGLIKSYNLIDRQGPMSVTTTAPEYRERFLDMCSKIVEVKERLSEEVS